VHAFQRSKQQATGCVTGEEQHQARVNVAPKKEASRDGVGEWFFDGSRECAKDTGGDSEDDAEGDFQMVAGSEIQGTPATSKSSPSRPRVLTTYIDFEECDIADENALEDGYADDLQQSPEVPCDSLLRHSDRCSTEKQPQAESLDKLHCRLVEADTEIEFLRKRVTQLEQFSMSNEKAQTCEQKKEPKATNDEQDAKAHASLSPAADVAIRSLEKENVGLRFQLAELRCELDQGRMPMHMPWGGDEDERWAEGTQVTSSERPAHSAKESSLFSWSVFNPFATCGADCYTAPPCNRGKQEYVSTRRANCDGNGLKHI
jgi:hypothetical protein